MMSGNACLERNDLSCRRKDTRNRQ